MNAIREFIEQRRAICNERIAELQAQERELKARLSQCTHEIATLQGEILELDLAFHAIGTKGQQSQRLKTSEDKVSVTIKDAILAVLAEAPAGLIALDILNRINKRFGLKLVRTSLSPQLTRLKNAGKVTLRGSIWLLANHSTERSAGDLDGEHEIGPEDSASGP